MCSREPASDGRLANANLLKPSRSVTVLALIGIGALTWFTLDRVEPAPDWVQVDGPRYIEAGQALRLRVRLAPLETAQFLTTDLHWAQTHDRSEGYLNTGGAREVGRGGGSYDFVIQVPASSGLCFVRAVVFLSRTGGWETHSRVAGSDFINVVTNSLSASQMRVVPLRLRYEHRPGAPGVVASKAPRFLTGLLFLVAAALGWGNYRTGKCNPEPNKADANRWAKAVAALIAAALWEFAGAESRVDVLVRTLAHSEDWYYLRGGIQKVAVSAIVVAVLLVASRVLRGNPRHQLLTGFLLFYLALSAINLVSLHSIDQLANLTWRGVTLIQMAKLGCATALTIVALSVRRAKS